MRMDRTEMFNKVAEIASDVLGIDIDEITEQTTFDDLDADSLDRLQLVTAIEDEFDIEMDEERLLTIASVSDAPSDILLLYTIPAYFFFISANTLPSSPTVP